MKEGFSCITIVQGDAAYPALLAQIEGPPKELYVRGNAALLQTTCFSVVGSRSVSDYGRRAIELIVPPIARLFTIVSGMALGADAMAHCVALNQGTPTIAVLGCGVDDDSLYPRSHVSLAHRILDSGGCLVSEYPPGTRANPIFFPARNRIVAGLSRGVLITEAARDSGSMITARFALDNGRDVFAIPGSIFSPLCEGTNDLLRQGAAPATCGRDILNALGIEESPMQPQLGLALPPAAQKIYALLTERPLTVGEIMTRLGDTNMNAIALISELELAGVVERRNGKIDVVRHA
ncbi:MAG: DNA protecting protein DprA [Candidatus Magasanikbacteria bacterium RIFCSPHIGHO2_02_FULL_50_9b]|uniref:DNA protecting protein DprA n=1 Tax=Candidatus Magasanikbacteria bacterium RIFCSPHIGHO2_02_FULL_50_9b TaxID=1798682 RepID=A0A1F6M777_9BACT|nr:MAG: DNA protecting protein DprA [Candidatus Magasanikbacteria bacterium RIFCSPHIGHO2_02_FULL_50_9b]